MLDEITVLMGLLELNRYPLQMHSKYCAESISNDPDGLDLFARALRAMKSHGAVSNQLAARRTVRLLDTVDCGLP